MNQTTRKLVFSALFLALAFVLPFLTGQIPQIGSALLPMHLPVLLCGFVCGWPWGLIVGFAAPLLRSLCFGMPLLPALPTQKGLCVSLSASRHARRAADLGAGPALLRGAGCFPLRDRGLLGRRLCRRSARHFSADPPHPAAGSSLRKIPLDRKVTPYVPNPRPAPRPLPGLSAGKAAGSS